MENFGKVRLGARYRDVVTEIEGIAVAEARYLTGCNGVCLQSEREGKMHDVWFDVTRVEMVGDGVVLLEDQSQQAPTPWGPFNPTAPTAHAPRM